MNVPETGLLTIFTDRDTQKAVILSLFGIFLVIEKYFAWRKDEPEAKKKSYSVNLLIFVFNDIFLSLLSVSSLLMIADRYSEYGLLHTMRNGFLKTFLVFILLDATLYFWHRERHARPFLWMFHKVHHSDLCMNTATTFRLHFVEVFLTTVVKSIFIVLVGVPAVLVLFCEMFITVIVMFNHSNISFRGEKMLGKVFIVPCKHVVHHSSIGSEQHMNFGFALSVWDRLLGTCKKTVPLALGLHNMEEQGVFDTILLRFKRKG